MAEFQLYKDNAGEFRWRFVSDNGRTISVSSEGYTGKATAERSIEIMKEEGPTASVVDQT